MFWVAASRRFLVTSETSIVVGLVFSSPFVLYFLVVHLAWAYRGERRSTMRFCQRAVLFCWVLVLLSRGVGCVCIFVEVLDRQGIVPEWTDNYVSFVTMMMAAFGLTFEMPVVLGFGSSLITYRTLGAARRYAILFWRPVAAFIADAYIDDFVDSHDRPV